jgi:hypothetical protein
MKKSGEQRYKESMTRVEKRREARRKKEEEKHRKKKYKQAIKMLNGAVKTRLGASRGKVVVYAMRNIKKGDRLYVNVIPELLDLPYEEFDKIRPDVREMILEHFPQVVNGSHFMCPDTLMQIYVQHNNKPNYDFNTDKAKRDIFKGEEITQDFRKMEKWEKIKKFFPDVK